MTPDAVACFTVNPSTTVMVYQDITTSNCSQNSTSQIWLNGDGKTSTDFNQTFSYNQTGTDTLQLICQGKNGKSSTTSQNIHVAPASGSISFGQSGATNYGAITVTLYGMTRQITKTFPNGLTDCTSPGAATFSDLTPSTYSYTARNAASNYTWSGTVRVNLGECTTKELY